MTRMTRARIGEPRADTQTHLEVGSGRVFWVRVIVLDKGLFAHY